MRVINPTYMYGLAAKVIEIPLGFKDFSVWKTLYSSNMASSTVAAVSGFTLVHPVTIPPFLLPFCFVVLLNNFQFSQLYAFVIVLPFSPIIAYVRMDIMLLARKNSRSIRQNLGVWQVDKCVFVSSTRLLVIISWFLGSPNVYVLG
jgi:hypothetical protein